MNNYLYISSRKNFREYLEDNFNNIYFIKSNPYQFEIKKIIKKIKKENIKQVIIEDYFVGIKDFIDVMNHNNVDVKMIWTNGLATLNEEIELGNLIDVMSLVESNKIKTIGFTEENIYLTMQDKKNVHKISLTINSKDKFNNSFKNVGIIGESDNWRSNMYNQLSAIKLLDGYSVNGLCIKRIFRRFCRFFNINFKNYGNKFTVSNFRNLLKQSDVISCVEFSNYLDFYVMDSFNHGIPCILGNNVLFFKGTELEKLVVVKSDDNINEIAEKINYVIKNKKQINKIYENIKKQYDDDCIKAIEKFIKE